jgi:hypothetical protein
MNKLLTVIGTIALLSATASASASTLKSGGLNVMSPATSSASFLFEEAGTNGTVKIGERESKVRIGVLIGKVRIGQKEKDVRISGSNGTVKIGEREGKVRIGQKEKDVRISGSNGTVKIGEREGKVRI